MWRTNSKKSTSISISTRKRSERWEKMARERTKKHENIMFDTHLMLFGYITRIFVYTIWHMLRLLCFSKTLSHSLTLSLGPVFSSSHHLFIITRTTKYIYLYKCRTFHSEYIYIYIYPPFCTKKKSCTAHHD